VGDPALGTACEACWGSLNRESAPNVEFKALPAPAFDAACAAYAYQGPLRELVHAWKFEGHPSLRRPFAAAIKARCGEIAAWRCDGVVALPLSRRSWRLRCYDGPGALADGLAAHLGVPRLKALVWLRERETQSRLDLADRQANAAGALGVLPGFDLRGRRLLLVDDLLSSGATAHDGAWALRSNGTEFIGLAALAHAIPE
jgi:predicted amidophosphoribosyltransferase